MMNRCEWAKDEPNITYHDNEWGRPQHDDKKLFEFLILEGAQAGLSWITILKRRDGYRNAFSDFNALKVANYTQKHVEKLLKNKSIIRNRLKVNSAINNAKQFLKIQSEFGSFDQYLWRFVNHKPIKNKFKNLDDLPISTEISEKLSKDLKKHGFNFVGPTICYALMQAIGMVNDHTSNCHLYQKQFLR
ncbi:MAG: DNA-3-methyladenine glycosylase I [Candidatus Hydrothermae bacterium]|nr:DNA-3-methyladenine glycosylase I [Candidatus Hydrothermae bacterium]